MEINDILNGFNDCSDCGDDCGGNNSCNNNCGCLNNCGCNNNCGCGNNSWLLIIILLACCGGGFGGSGNMGYGYNNCGCCCCEKPKFKKCTETVYVPENPCSLMGTGNMGAGGFGFEGGFWWIIILLLIFCGGFGGNCGFNNCNC